MAAVVHERGLAVVDDLGASSETGRPSGSPSPGQVPPTSVYVADAYAATLAGTEVRLWDLTNATELWRQDLGAWSREKKLGAPVCAVPDRRDPKRLTVVFSSRERTDLQVLDFSRGSLELAASASNLPSTPAAPGTWWNAAPTTAGSPSSFQAPTRRPSSPPRANGCRARRPSS